MMQFLRSILSGSKTKENDALNKKLRVSEARITLLEIENKKSAEAVHELSACLQNVVMMMSDMSVDLRAVGDYIQAQVEESQRLAKRDKLLSFSRFSDDDDPDDGGYLN